MDRRKGRKKRLARLILLILAISAILFFLSNNNSSKIKIATIPTPTPTCTSIDYKTNNFALGESVKSELIGTHGTYGIVIKNFKTGEIFSQNEDTVFDSASLYKLWVLVVVYEQISQGKLTLSQSLSANYADLNKEFHLDPKLAEKTSGSITITIKDALIQMITVSDNYSALILTRQIGINSLEKFLIKNCFTQSKVGVNGSSPTTSASDVASFFEKLYRGKLADKKTTTEMINLLKQQKFTDKIPKYLPYVAKLAVAHKTGELDPYSHDGGIVYSEAGDYIIVIMSKSDSRDLANARIANVSKAVYSFFNPKNLNASSSSELN